ncbi:ssDNA endonuclease and repair protein rad10, partial [Spiromyces aspiralis]
MDGKGGSSRAPQKRRFYVPTVDEIEARRSRAIALRGNPILAHVRNVPWEYGEIEPDYVVGRTACVLFLSLRYHRLHPEYIYNRIERLKRTYSLRILLTFVDTDEHQAALRELNKIAIMGDMTLFLAWSSEEAGRYLETFKAYEFRSHDAIKERVEQGYLPQLTKTLTQIKSVNTTDVQTLSTVFGSLRQLSRASQEEIVLCPGFGNQK